MTKKTRIVIVIMIAVVIALGYILGKNLKEASDIRGNKVLIESSHINHLMGLYNGIVLLENGDICEFDFKGDKIESNRTLVQKNDDIQEHITKKIKKMDEKDLSLLKEYLYNIEDEYEEKSSNNLKPHDVGYSRIDFCDYNKNKNILLSGGTIGRNTKNISDNIDEILEILQKYDI